MTIQALYSAATGMTAMETKLDVVANNLANMETTAFKRDRANFEDLIYRHEAYPEPRIRPANILPPALKSVWACVRKARKLISPKGR